jgi:hypothetical protein
MNALALLVANTKCVRRSLDLLQVASLMEKAAGELGGENRLAARLSLSPEMVRQFLSARRLSPHVAALVRRRKIDGVDVAYRLSLLIPKEQRVVADAFASGRISGKELRAVVSMRRSYPKMRIEEVIGRIAGTRPTREYAIVLRPFPAGLSAQQLRSLLEGRLGKGNVRSVETATRRWFVVLSVDGKKQLEQAAEAQRTSKKHLIEVFLGGRG